METVKKGDFFRSDIGIFLVEDVVDNVALLDNGAKIDVKILTDNKYYKKFKYSSDSFMEDMKDNSFFKKLNKETISSLKKKYLNNPFSNKVENTIQMSGRTNTSYESLMSDLDDMKNISELDEEQVLSLKEKFKEIENSLKEKIKPKTITISGPTHKKIRERCSVSGENIGDWAEKTLLAGCKIVSDDRQLIDCLKKYKERLLNDETITDAGDDFLAKTKLVNRVNMDIEYYIDKTGLYFDLNNCAPSPYIVNVIKNIPNEILASMPYEDIRSEVTVDIPQDYCNYKNPDYLSEALIHHMNSNNLDIAISIKNGKYSDDLTKKLKANLSTIGKKITGLDDMNNVNDPF